MMFASLPKTALEFMDWSWTQIEPYYQDLASRPLDAQNVEAWLADWTRLSDLVSETFTRLNVAVTLDTTDQEAEARYNAFVDQIYPQAQTNENKLKEKLLASRLEPDGFELPLRKMRTEAAIFREANLPLLSEERKLMPEYDKIASAQTITWQGEELTQDQLRLIFSTSDRATREQVWRLAAGRKLADREAINQLWVRFLNLRRPLAENAGLRDYRGYRWQQMLRLDYSPQDCLEFHQAIEQVAVPAATRVYEKYRQRIGVDHLRPWDLDLDLFPYLSPSFPVYGGSEALQANAEKIFRKLDPQLGEYFHTMKAEGLLDLDNRKRKAPGGYCEGFPITRRPFIFMNAVGIPDDIHTLLHEAGHAFHYFEVLHLPYAQQRDPGLEFAEVASTAMDLMASAWVAEVGFYTEEYARQFRLIDLGNFLLFWPYMAVVDAFQHWAYTHPDQSSKPNNCDAEWLELWKRFLPGVDWSGLEVEAMTGWQRKSHIYHDPFYYVEYGLAQMGALQVLRNVQRDPATAMEQYRRALRLGGTANLPALYQTCGAKLAFDAQTLAEVVQFTEQTMGELEAS